MTLATTLEWVEAFTPARSVQVEDAAASLGLTRYQARMFRRFHGMGALRIDPAIDLFDLILGSARSLLARLADPGVIKYLLFAHTVIEVTPAHLDASRVFAQRLGLAGVNAFALTQQNCASGLAAIDIAGELLRADGDPQARALVLTGEKPFTPLAQLIANTTVMGEASSACLVALSGPGERVCSYTAVTEGRYSDGPRLCPEELKRFNDTYTASLTDVIVDAVARAGLEMSDITMIIPHNVNRLLWLRTIDQLGVGRDRIYLDNIPCYSHCYCTDPFLNLVALRDAGQLSEGAYYLLTSVGLGATYAAMVIEHRQDDPHHADGIR
ncbi:MAG TPA: 3-oxoacyl-[acyl-carrier-protein] synthase III C-terminal domain-containing protein [Streptosporangiaceae bacterium]|jgi:3-oxoacyl-[acyl-carrier-protein] synthase-3